MLESDGVADGETDLEEEGWLPVPVTEDSLVSAKQQLAEAVEGLVDVLRAPDVVRSIRDVDRANLAKYLTITKIRLENAIAMVRSGEAG
jgi:hypothetical protein